MSGSSGALLPILIVLIVLVIDSWVYADTKAHQERGEPVSLSTGFINLETPTDWLISCLFLGIVFIPLYIMRRAQNR